MPDSNQTKNWSVNLIKLYFTFCKTNKVIKNFAFLEEIMELSGKLKNLQQREYELERELSLVKSNLEEFTKSYQQLQTSFEEAVEKSSKLKLVSIHK